METKYGIFISYHRNNVFLDEPSDRVECLWPSLDVPFPILGYSFGAKEMAGTSHTLSCLSKLRSSLDLRKSCRNHRSGNSVEIPDAPVSTH